jgi:hypothetical protein
MDQQPANPFGSIIGSLSWDCQYTRPENLSLAALIRQGRDQAILLPAQRDADLGDAVGRSANDEDRLAGTSGPCAAFEGLLPFGQREGLTDHRSEPSRTRHLRQPGELASVRLDDENMAWTLYLPASSWFRRRRT